MVLVIDNYDSFTYNLVQYLGEMTEVKVFRNDKITISEINEINPNHIIISPGPGRPKNAGISKQVINYFKDKIPILGVCLGHQCIGEVFGAKIVRADRLLHGKVSLININQEGIEYEIFNNIKSPFSATRYHSLIVESESIPAELKILARTDRGEIMAMVHCLFPVYGVQFHPESILTDVGKRFLSNFINLTEGE